MLNEVVKEGVYEFIDRIVEKFGETHWVDREKLLEIWEIDFYYFF
jgi:hypothetical protein